ncbi:MAG: hypothetical protein CEO12_411 [Parcubacteria group bacterium Gr01-1014_46]|nr:MAG: hypothetical protein CEO12_411 [Parcubacteria group bacterium Gr01-1014_46]
MKPILSIAVIAVCIGVYFVYIRPMTVDIKLLNIKKAEYKNVLNRVKEINEKREAILSEYNSIPEADIDRLNKMVPETLNSVELLNNLSVIGAQHGIIIKEFRAVDTSSNNSDVVSNTGSPYKTNTITMRLTGQYNQFINYLWNVESGLSLIDVTNLIIRSSSEGGKGPALMDFTLEAKVYSLR